MKLSSEFTVPSAPEQVFPLFLDAQVMRQCIPGCEELVRVDDTTFRGRLVSSVAHVRFNAAFSAQVQSIDEPHSVKALLKGEDNRLGSSINIDASLGVKPHDDGTLVSYEMDMAIWGKIGRLGESIVRRRTAEVEAQFVERFSAAASAGTEPAAAAAAVAAPRKEAPAAKAAGAPATGTPTAATPTAATPTPSATPSRPADVLTPQAVPDGAPTVPDRLVKAGRAAAVRVGHLLARVVGRVRDRLRERKR